MWASSSARIGCCNHRQPRKEHQPPKFSPFCLNQLVIPNGYLNYLEQKYRDKGYARYQLSLIKRYDACYKNPSLFFSIPESHRNNVLKACAVYAKFTGEYEEYRLRLRQHAVTFVNHNTSFKGFVSMLSKKHSDLPDYVAGIKPLLTASEFVFLKFLCVTGLRAAEAVESFNMIRELSQRGELGDYYNAGSHVLEHYKFPKFLRCTKNCFISFVSQDLIDQISFCDQVTYPALHCRFGRAKQRLRFKELRSFNNTFMRNNGLLAEEIDCCSGRVGKSVFVRNYYGINLDELGSRVFSAQVKLCNVLGLDM